MRKLICFALVFVVAFAARAQSADTCPPQASAPTAQQVQAAQAQAKDRGFLWRVSKDGRTHHLFGTIHVGKLEWAFPGAKLRAALADAQTVAFELDPLDPAVQSSLRTAGAGSATLPAALDAQLKRELQRACLPAQALAGLHPMMQAMTAVMVDAARDGLQLAYGQEFVLAGAAQARNLRTVSLETPERQLAAIIPNDPAQAERSLASTLEQLQSGLGRKVLLRMAAAWERRSAGDRELRALVRLRQDRRRPRDAHGAQRRAQPGAGRSHRSPARRRPAPVRGRRRAAHDRAEGAAGTVESARFSCRAGRVSLGCSCN